MALTICSCKTNSTTHKKTTESLFNAEQNLYSWPVGFEVSGKKPEYKDISSYWVPAQISENKLTEAHKVWIIEGELQWIQK